ncbi:MAG: acyl-CoA synthetase FdrA [Anaerolineae bacterium]|nr:acyl-CoA synthetase FdrA [Anaerolineae bacterium]
MTIHFTVRPGFYADSVVLMNIARELRQLEGVQDAGLVMGTEANKALLGDMTALSTTAQAAQPTDLIIMIDVNEAVLASALEKVDSLLSARSSTESKLTAVNPRSLRSAKRMYPDANLAIISVPGQYAAAEAWQALHNGLHVFLFSDNVALQDELALKTYAAHHGLLVMGPGAGTAIINGVGLGFANAIPRGNVGIVSASGTGLQEVSTLLAKLGSGVSQAIGVGGRDLSDTIGGIMATQAIALLQQDSATEVIVAISKLPSDPIAGAIMDQLAAGSKPAVVIFLSPTLPAAPEGVYTALTLHEAAVIAHALTTGNDSTTVLLDYAKQVKQAVEQAVVSRSRLAETRVYLRGLFSGGTLCEEAMRVWAGCVGDVWSNGPLNPVFKLPNARQSQAHSALDLGDEEFTVGRPHPMIDNELRIQRLLTEADDPQVAAIQMDVVIGYSAHLNPAAELAPAIQHVTKQIPVILSITGTNEDIQHRAQQQALLEAAGAIVLESNALASHFTAHLAGAPHVTS